MNKLFCIDRCSTQQHLCCLSCEQVINCVKNGDACVMLNFSTLADSQEIDEQVKNEIIKKCDKMCNTYEEAVCKVL